MFRPHSPQTPPHTPPHTLTPLEKFIFQFFHGINNLNLEWVQLSKLCKRTPQLKKTHTPKRRIFVGLNLDTATQTKISATALGLSDMGYKRYMHRSNPSKRLPNEGGCHYLFHLGHGAILFMIIPLSFYLSTY